MIMAKKGNRRLIHGQQKITVIISLLVLKINMTSDNKKTQTEKKTELIFVDIAQICKVFPKSTLHIAEGYLYIEYSPSRTSML